MASKVMVWDRGMEKDHRNASGFTLVEVIICVTILAIASAVLLQSFSLASMTNAKAQKMQNATSLAETVMEEVKSSSIRQLQKKYNGGADTVKKISVTDSDFCAKTAQEKASSALAEAGGSNASALLTEDSSEPAYYVLCKGNTYATQSGDKYDVTATMRTAPYSMASVTDASNANSKKLPVINEIDKHTKTVLTGKELNKYDIAAADYFHEHTVDAGDIKIAAKEISIDKSGDGGAGSSGIINVKCTVIYTADDGSTKYSKEVFKGTYVSQIDKDGNYQPVDNDIYIFYNRFMWDSSSVPGSPGPETITVKDDSNNDNHRVYLIAQKELKLTKDDKADITDLTGTTVNITRDGVNNLISASSNAALTYTDGVNTFTGRVKSGDYWLITNLAGDKSILEKQKKDRVFEVTVDVTKPGDSKVYASLTSTVEVRE
ncbi:MAG: type II secretion system GspH family protein [Lachnospiraceae bacterium]|nr:type II secretion system GspH family protein [Lachnospiraceae bacterium]